MLDEATHPLQGACLPGAEDAFLDQLDRGEKAALVDQVEAVVAEHLRAGIDVDTALTNAIARVVDADAAVRARASRHWAELAEWARGIGRANAPGAGRPAA